MSKLTQKQFNEMHDKLTDIIVEYSNHLIEDHIQSTSFKLTNGFTVTFKDRKSSKTRERENSK